ncbi:hypothetical protein [Salinicola sp. CPA57]|uniref:hypothetical protein n=1 Tax=Salinicola sp. CPA57 TaxID=1949080 RepID=UPI000DA1EB53|nr:hypothetical protein [Salinicola sp. CPA57]
MRKAPWPDYAGNQIHEGDTLTHPSGETGKVIFLETEKDPHDQWRVDYADQYLRLALQIGDKGQALVTESPSGSQ